MRSLSILIFCILMSEGALLRGDETPTEKSPLTALMADSAAASSDDNQAQTIGYSVSSAEDLFDETDAAIASRSAVACEEPVCRYKKQAVQSIAVTSGWVQSTGSNDLSSSFFETSIGFGVPLGNFDNILGVTPSFRMDWMDAAPSIDIPATLYETGVSFFWQRPLNDRWGIMLLGGPSVRSDFTTSDNAIRLFGMGLLTWDAKPDRLQLSMGAVYLGRADLPALPAVGLKWTPSPQTRLDLRFPESTLSFRLEKNGSRSELWSYLSAGFGGNTWAVTRASGDTDELSTRDLRIAVGMQRVNDGGGGWYAEFGYAFARRIEYENTQTEVSLADGVLLRASWRY